MKLYERAIEEDAPVRLLNREGDGNLQDAVEILMSRGEILFDIMTEILQGKQFPNVMVNDIMFTYVKAFRKEGYSFDDIVPSIREFLRELRREKREEMEEEDEDVEDNEEVKEEDEEEEDEEDLISVDRLEVDYGAWRDEIEKELTADNFWYGKLSVVSEQITKIDPVPSTELEVDTVDLIFTPIYHGGEIPIPDDGLEIFNDISMSEHLCFVAYRKKPVGLEEGQLLSKVYTSSDKLKTLPYGVFVPEDTNLKVPDILYFRLWVGAESLYKGVQREIITAYYDLTKGTLTVETVPLGRGVTEEMIRTIFESSFSLLSFSNPPTETAISGSFNLYLTKAKSELRVNNVALLDMILNDWKFSVYLFVSESDKPSAEKKDIRIKYRSIVGENDENIQSSLSARLKNEVATTKMGKINEGQDYISVNINGGYSRKYIDDFRFIFTRQMKIYLLKYEEILEEYYDVVPPLSESSIKAATTPTKRGKKGGVSSQALKEALPDAFISGYTADCQGKQQPIIIPEDQVELWKEQKFTYDAKEYNRQVLTYPVDAPKIYLGCPTDSYPFPGLKRNERENKEAYPYFPCCFRSNHMETVGSLYNQVALGAEEKKRRVTPSLKGHQVKTGKILPSGRKGSIPSTIGKLLAQYKLGVKAEDFVRIGVPTSPSCSLHALCRALDDEGYMKLENESDAEKEKYIRKRIRPLLTTEVFPGVVRQEMYNFNETEISALMKDPQRYLDPSLFYRALEALGRDLNVFVFVMKKEESEMIGEIELPRSKFYSIRPYRPRNASIILLKHPEEDHVEIIGYDDKKRREVVTKFDVSMTYHLYIAFLNASRMRSWAFDNEILVGQQHLETMIDYEKFLNLKDDPDDENSEYRSFIRGQVIDEYGKVRAFLIESIYGVATVFTPPTQPLNVETFDRSSIPECTLEEAIRIFGEPTGCSHREGKMNGLWYIFMGRRDGLYVPIQLTEGDLEVLLPDPLRTTGRNIAIEAAQLRRTGLVLLQLLRYLYLLSGRDMEKMKNLIVVKNFKDTDYKIKGIPTRLPEFSNVEDAVEYLESVEGSIFQNGKFMAYSDKFRTNLLGKLEEFEKATQGLRISIPSRIDGLFFFETDFELRPDTALFLRKEDLGFWKGQQQLNESGIRIFDELTSTTIESNEPIIFLEEGEQSMIIQKMLRLAPSHVEDRERVAKINKMRALTVGYFWITQLINIGEAVDDETVLKEEPAHKIYQIAIDKKSLVVVEDNSGGAPVFVRLLRAGNDDKYSVILPLEWEEK